MQAARAAIRRLGATDETAAAADLLAAAPPAPARRRVEAAAAELVREMRARPNPGLMETFLAEYGLSTDEGVALMCLAEALLRVPDTATIDALIRDKIAPADWSSHLGRSTSPMVNASTWALMLTGRVVAGGDVPGTMRGLMRRAGEPVVRRAVAQAMRVMGHQFVLGRDIDEALVRAREWQQRGCTYSYDMLGEAARTAGDARRYFLSYSRAIAAIAATCSGTDVRANPGISVKLSALHPRYEQSQRARVMTELVPRVQALALHARHAGMGFNIDAEEVDRLELSLDVIEAALRAPDLAGWDGFGIVVQGYGRRAPGVIDWVGALAASLGRRLMVRLVKGAYWDTEVKVAQVGGFDDYKVFTRKVTTDVSYLTCARQLLGMTDRIYPQFATHNAHTVAAILDFAGPDGDFEFQRLHGMGEALHGRVQARHGTRLRIYAPVGVHEDLLAYLVRRLLENGANSSFVHQVLDPAVPVESIVRDPFDTLAGLNVVPNPRIPRPPDLFPDRRNARGWNLADPAVTEPLLAAMEPWRTAQWRFGAGHEVTNPADRADIVGAVTPADPTRIDAALAAAAASNWGATPVTERAACLERAADAMEANAPELIALCVREAGKTIADGVAEVREAVDFCRYYALRARMDLSGRTPRGVFACISPWNFPLAIFTGQVAAALVAGNAVVAKPAPQTPLIAARAVALLHAAGVPADALHLLPGDGAVGAALASDPLVAGVCFTGSTATARRIDAAMAEHLAPDAPLIAETGGLNAMIVDSTALPEQAIRDAVASAFTSAGQRCSALRILCVQEDVAPALLTMLAGAMAELAMGDPWLLATDIGPVIDPAARDKIEAHCAALDVSGRRIARLPDRGGCFVPPCAYRLDSVDELDVEIFGPVLHVVTFRATELPALVERLNAKGYGLTLGLHTRVGARVERVARTARVGNLYVNRNQIGAVVGVQPFGGEGLSGAGPKAGGPNYLLRFSRPGATVPSDAPDPSLVAALRRAVGRPDPVVEAALAMVAAAGLEPQSLPGPAGESNRLTTHPRGRVLLAGPGMLRAAIVALATGNTVTATDEALRPLFQAVSAELGPVAAIVPAGEAAALIAANDPALVVAWEDAAAFRRALAARPGPIVPLVCDAPEPFRFVLERCVSVDVTAAGGNVHLLAEADAA
jgi:RHH-type proline utilization regulon transcriptional repressor/proline dehydrogenase/delta 1-pyrroline-5-carboxylate dehydrogenase